MSEVFYMKRGGELIVKCLYTDYINDVMIVEYNTQEYTLNWNTYYSYYEGTVAGQIGFLV
jgi:hypothetical protein